MNCTNVVAIDNPVDLGIPDGSWYRTKVPLGATELLRGIPDCFNGDNIGFFGDSTF